MSTRSVYDLHVHARAVKAVLAGDGLPEGSTDLVALYVCQSYVPSFFHIHHHIHIGRFGGEPVQQIIVSQLVPAY